MPRMPTPILSATSGTILAVRKMAYVDLVAAIVMMANAAKGMSALQLARDLHCQHKTAFVLMHKLREALAAETKDTKLHGIVEVDGGYFGGHIRPANLAKDRVDRRLASTKPANGGSLSSCVNVAGGR